MCVNYKSDYIWIYRYSSGKISVNVLASILSEYKLERERDWTDDSPLSIESCLPRWNYRILTVHDRLKNLNIMKNRVVHRTSSFSFFSAVFFARQRRIRSQESTAVTKQRTCANKIFSRGPLIPDRGNTTSTMTRAPFKISKETFLWFPPLRRSKAQPILRFAVKTNRGETIIATNEVKRKPDRGHGENEKG